MIGLNILEDKTVPDGEETTDPNGEERTVPYGEERTLPVIGMILTSL